MKDEARTHFQMRKPYGEAFLHAQRDQEAEGEEVGNGPDTGTQGRRGSQRPGEGAGALSEIVNRGPNTQANTTTNKHGIKSHKKQVKELKELLLRSSQQP